MIERQKSVPTIISRHSRLISVLLLIATALSPKGRLAQAIRFQSVVLLEAGSEVGETDE